MVPAGQPTESTIASLRDVMDKDDIVIDGGNSYFKDDIKHSDMLGEKGMFLSTAAPAAVYGD